MSELSESIAQFRTLHAYAKAATLTAAERQLYETGKRELVQIFVAAQRLALRPGETARRTLRIPLVLPVRLEFPAWQESAATTDLSCAGFGARLKRTVPIGTAARFSMILPGMKALTGLATVLWIGRQVGDTGARASFLFDDLSEPNRYRLEIVIFDDVLSILGA
jgi:hypothetical protein